MSRGWSSNMRENEKPVLTIIAQGFLRDLQHMRNVMPALVFYLSFLFLDVFSQVSSSGCMVVSQWKPSVQHGAVQVLSSPLLCQLYLCLFSAEIPKVKPCYCYMHVMRAPSRLYQCTCLMPSFFACSQNRKSWLASNCAQSQYGSILHVILLFYMRSATLVQSDNLAVPLERGDYDSVYHYSRYAGVTTTWLSSGYTTSSAWFRSHAGVNYKEIPYLSQKYQ